MKTALRIHIIPIGRDKEDLERMTLPAIFQKADKVYIFAFPKSRNVFEHVVDMVVDALTSQLRLKLNVDLFIIRVVFYDYQNYMMEIANIAQKEQKEGNTVFYNITSGGTIPAFAGMQAKMLFNVQPYYSVKNYETNVIPNPPQIIDYSDFFINKPPEELIRFLVNIRCFMEFNGLKIEDHDKITKKECLFLFGLLNPHDDISKRKSGDFNKLNLRYIDKLVALNYIIVEPQPRGKIFFTRTGIFAMEIFASYYQIQPHKEAKTKIKDVFQKSRIKNPSSKKSHEDDDPTDNED